MKTKKAPSPQEASAPAIVGGSSLYRFATPEDLKVSRAQKTANTKGWKARIASALNLGNPAVRQMRNLGSLASLKQSRQRGEILLSGHANCQSVLDWHDEAIERVESGEDAEEIRSLFASVRAGEKDSVAALASAVTRTTGMMLQASATWTNFFEQVTLGDADQFVAQRRVGSETSVRVVGQDGGSFTQSPQNNFSFDPVALLNVATDIFEYPLWDIETGDGVRDNALNSVDLAGDLMAKVDEIAASQIVITSPNTMLTASFTTTGPLQDRSYVAHSRVNTDNLPAGNIIILSDNGAATLPRRAALLAIIDYASSFGANAFPGQDDLRAEAIHVPSKLASAFLHEVSVNGASNGYTDGLIRKGPFQIEFGGEVFTIVPDNTLDPASPYMYVRFNRPVGFFIDKPTQSRTIVDEGPARQRLNLGQVSQTRAVGFASPVNWGCNILAVKFAD